MRYASNESPINQLPAIVWILSLPMIASEAVFALARLGFMNNGMGGQGAALAMRQIAAERTAFLPSMLYRAWDAQTVMGAQLWRILTYSFISASFTQALFVVVFLLALGNMVGSVFRPLAVVALFFGSAIGGALVFTLCGLAFPRILNVALIGGYPAVYGLIGAFTFLIWVRLGQQNANRMRAFTMIAALMAFQLVFGIIFQDTTFLWIADIAGFATGFLLSFVLIPGGFREVVAQLRQR